MAPKLPTLLAPSLEEILQVGHVARQHVPPMTDAGRNTLKKGVMARYGLIVGGLVVNAQQEVGIQLHAHGVEASVCVSHYQLHVAQTVGLGFVKMGKLVGKLAHAVGIVVPVAHGLAVEGHHAVATAHAGFHGRRTGLYGIYHKRYTGQHEARIGLHHVEHVEIAGQGKGHFLSAAPHHNLTGLGNTAVHVAHGFVGVEALEGARIGAQGMSPSRKP